jgi:hypothetical protein
MFLSVDATRRPFPDTSLAMVEKEVYRVLHSVGDLAHKRNKETPSSSKGNTCGFNRLLVMLFAVLSLLQYSLGDF